MNLFRVFSCLYNFLYTHIRRTHYLVKTVFWAPGKRKRNGMTCWVDKICLFSKIVSSFVPILSMCMFTECDRCVCKTELKIFVFLKANVFGTLHFLCSEIDTVRMAKVNRPTCSLHVQPNMHNMEHNSMYDSVCRQHIHYGIHYTVSLFTTWDKSIMGWCTFQ